MCNAIGAVLRSFHEKAVFVNADVAAVFYQLRLLPHPSPCFHPHSL